MTRQIDALPVHVDESQWNNHHEHENVGQNGGNHNSRHDGLPSAFEQTCPAFRSAQLSLIPVAEENGARHDEDDRLVPGEDVGDSVDDVDGLEHILSAHHVVVLEVDVSNRLVGAIPMQTYVAAQIGDVLVGVLQPANDLIRSAMVRG